MKSISKRLTYANVMSSIAVFLVLGGGAALAAKTVLPKKSVGAKQLKANSVTSAKLKNNAVTTKKIKNNAVNGTKVNEATLGEVPSAASATTAGNAGTVNGIAVTKLLERSAGGTAEKDIFNNGHLRITFACDGGGNVEIKAYTLSDHAAINSYGTSSDTDNGDFNIADNPETISESDEERDLVYTDESGNVVALQYLVYENRSFGPQCIFAGFAQAQ